MLIAKKIYTFVHSYIKRRWCSLANTGACRAPAPGSNPGRRIGFSFNQQHLEDFILTLQLSGISNKEIKKIKSRLTRFIDAVSYCPIHNDIIVYINELKERYFLTNNFSKSPNYKCCHLKSSLASIIRYQANEPSFLGLCLKNIELVAVRFTNYEKNFANRFVL